MHTVDGVIDYRQHRLRSRAVQNCGSTFRKACLPFETFDLAEAPQVIMFQATAVFERLVVALVCGEDQLKVTPETLAS